MKENKKENKSENEFLKKACYLMKHRGPDDKGFVAKPSVGLASVRLSIIDLSKAGHMPMESERGNIIVYNGEIYNFAEIRNELKKKGCEFKSNTDTEVILKAYEEWGQECLHKFNGMFAFALWDEKKKILFCARDRFGVKPFYYAIFGGKLIFASEIKVILAHPLAERKLSIEAVSSYLSYRYPLGDMTFFEGIKQLKPGHKLIAKKNEVNVSAWYELPFNETEDKGKEFFVKKTKELIKSAVKKRLVSDVPLGCYLSGGLIQA